jgi:hypothetical protein
MWRAEETDMRLDRPILIVGNPRSGTTLMLSYLERAKSLWRLGRESRFLWADVAHPFDDTRASLRSAQRAPQLLADVGAARTAMTARYARACYRGGDETAGHALRFMHQVVAQGANPWYYELPRDVLEARFGTPPVGPAGADDPGEIAPFTFDAHGEHPTLENRAARLRLLDKDTSHVYRIPLLRRLFPDARFVFVTRDGPSGVSSLIEAWRHPRWFFSYRMPAELRIAGYSDRFPWGRNWWNLNLPPDWRTLADRPLEEICAAVWASGNLEILAHAPELEALGQAVTVRYEDLVENPAGTLARVAEVVEIDPRQVEVEPGYTAPAVVTDEQPSPGKWRRNAALIESVDELIGPVRQRLGYPVAA